jgi:chromatin remodeling complex protein RSC6
MGVPSNNTVITQETQMGNISVQFDEIVTNLATFKTHITLLQQQVRVLDKIVKKQMNTLKKESSKNKNKGCRKPSGFARPTKVTKELCNFMNKTEGSEIARTEVTRALVSYIKTQNLEDKDNSRIIMPDNKLRELLGIEENKELTYFTIQKYMNKHFISSKTAPEINK